MIQVTLTFPSTEAMLAHFGAGLAPAAASSTANAALPEVSAPAPAAAQEEASAPKQRRSRKSDATSTSGAPDTAQAGQADQSADTSVAATSSDSMSGASESTQETSGTPGNATTTDTGAADDGFDPLAPAPVLATEEEVRKYAGGRIQADASFRPKLTEALAKHGVKALSEIKDPATFGALLTELKAL